ncbi:MAG: enoyl-CoA hydratase-related protein [Novosphingobium sp.]
MAHLSCTVETGLAHLRLANPAAGNVLDLPMIHAFSEALLGLSRSEVRAVLISAEGDNFCVGGDLNAMNEAADRGALLSDMAGAFHKGLAGLNALDVPVVTAINGVAAGGGLSLALAGDIVIGGKSSAYMMAYTAIGLSPDGGSSWILPRLVGLRLAQEMAFLNRRVNADEALAAGLVTCIVPDEVLLEEATDTARRLAEGPTAAFHRMKHLFGQSFGNDLGTQFEAEAEAITACAAGHDGGEGVRAFLERRKPAFRGE